LEHNNQTQQVNKTMKQWETTMKIAIKQKNEKQQRNTTTKNYNGRQKFNTAM
jgi:predicted transposase